MDLVNKLLQTGRMVSRILLNSLITVFLESAQVDSSYLIFDQLAGMSTDHCSKEKKDA